MHLAARNGTLCAPPSVYSYTRFSTPEQAQGDSFRRQAEAARKWAAQRGMILDDRLSLRDLGVSAYRGANTDTDAGLGAFLTACRSGLIGEGSYLLVESLDRLSRMTPLLAQRLFGDIVLAGVTIVTLNDGQEYSRARLEAEPMGLMIAFMVSARAHEESKTKGRRLAAAWEEKRRKVAAGETDEYTRRCPAWIIRDTEGWRLHPVHADTVRRVYRDTIAGAGEHAIAKALNADGIPVMTRGTMWHRSAVAKLLRNPAALGTLVTGHIDYGTGKRQRITGTPIPDFYPAAVTAEQWAAVRAVKDGTIARARGKSASAPVQNMLAGLARCPDCGAAMTRVYKGSRVKAGPAKLVCTRAKAGAANHGYVSVSLETVHDAIASDYAKLIADVPAGDRAPALDGEAVNLQGEIMAAENSLADLLDLLDREPSQALARRIRAAEASLSVLRADLEGIEQARAVADGGMVHTRLEALADAFDTPADTGGINAALRLLFAGVTIDHREGLLQFQWRQGGTTALRYAFAPDGV
jgi:DNA invertase Pin-like site-specific DNA recombinase